ncbi:uncharacterized protein LOC123700748 [Colias croceus]|uniref:uncharacterized protein LOC123700748 n=1 Tax=Colias crocea TaxID=72248 RepID=UPI001E27A53D|nr:uncharacterized protein LOC123700748 [Colias croceus]
MIIQEENEMPMEAPVIHESDNVINKCDNNEKQNKCSKSRKRRKSKNDLEPSSLQSEISTSNSTEISQNDLEELRSVYNKCKAVIKKIETKYGHLLNNDDSSNSETDRNIETSKCECTFNKRIVFDENGQQITQEFVPDMHICPKRQKFQPSTTTPSMSRSNVQIEDKNFLDSLPGDIKSLCDILKDPNIDIVYRNKVIEKIKILRLDNFNTMRFDRKLLIESMKLKPEEFFEFKGSNLSSLPGYPTKPSEEVEK